MDKELNLNKKKKIDFIITQNEALFINDRITLEKYHNKYLTDRIPVNLGFIKKISNIVANKSSQVKSSQVKSSQIYINWSELLILREISLSYVIFEGENIGKNLSIKISKCIIYFKKTDQKNEISKKVIQECNEIINKLVLEDEIE